MRPEPGRNSIVAGTKTQLLVPGYPQEPATSAPIQCLEGEFGTRRCAHGGGGGGQRVRRQQPAMAAVAVVGVERESSRIIGWQAPRKRGSYLSAFSREISPSRATTRAWSAACELSASRFSAANRDSTASDACGTGWRLLLAVLADNGLRVGRCASRNKRMCGECLRVEGARGVCRRIDCGRASLY